MGCFGITISSIPATFYDKLSGVMEYWSAGVLGKFEWILLMQFFTLLHHSSAPPLPKTP
jgi:hypothetical protein